MSLCLTFLSAGAQTFSISGNITDEQKNELVGVNVYIHETYQGSITNNEGNYIIKNIKPGSYHLHITYLGYHSESRDIKIENENLTLNFEMHPAVKKLHEILVESSVTKETQQRASISLETIDRSYLEQNQESTLMHSLQALPGINAINMGVGVSKPVIRGMSFNRVVVSDNGIKQEGQQWGSEHGLEIDQFNIEQLEIIKGPASLMYGSDAMGGVINIRHPKSAKEGKHESSILSQYSSVNNKYGVSANTKGNHKGNIYNLRVTGIFYGDYKVPADEFQYSNYILPIENNQLKNTAGKERHVAFTTGLNRNWGYSHFTISNYNQEVGIFSGAVGIPRAYRLEDDKDSRNIEAPMQKVNHFRVLNNSNFLLGKNWLELDIGYQHNHRQEFSLPDAHGRPIELSTGKALDLKLQTLSINTRFYAKTFKVLDGVYGIQGELQKNDFGGFEFLIPEYRSMNWGIFLLEKYNWRDQLFINGGVRLEYGGLDIEETNRAFYYQYELIDTIQRNPAVNRYFINYAAALGLSYAPHHDWNLKLNFGKTYRIPNAPELSANGVHHGTFRYEKGDENLDAEKGYQFDAGINLEKKWIHLSLTGYFNIYENFIYLNPTGKFARVEIDGTIYPNPEPGQVYEFRQAPANHTGMEAALELKPWKDLSINTAGDFTWIENRNTGEPLPFTPPGSIRSELTYDWNKPFRFMESANLGASHHYFAAQNRVARNEPATPAYHLVALSAGAQFVKKSLLIELNFKINNLLNTKYLNHLSRYRILNIPEPARNFQLSLKFKLAYKSRRS